MTTTTNTISITPSSGSASRKFTAPAPRMKQQHGLADDVPGLAQQISLLRGRQFVGSVGGQETRGLLRRQTLQCCGRYRPAPMALPSSVRGDATDFGILCPQDERCWRGVLRVADNARRAAGIAARQASRLAELVAHARTSSRFYAEHYRDVPAGPIRPAELRQLPPVHKLTLMAHFDDWVTAPRVTRAGVEEFVANPDNVGRDFLGRYVVFTTSGSTAEPALLVQDSGAIAVMTGLSYARSAGVLPPRLLARVLAGEHARRRCSPDVTTSCRRRCSNVGCGPCRCGAGIPATSPSSTRCRSLSHSSTTFSPPCWAPTPARSVSSPMNRRRVACTSRHWS